MMVLQATIELLPLSIGENDRLRHGGKTIPNILRQLNTLGHAQFENIGHGKFSHKEEANVFFLPRRVGDWARQK